MESIRLQHPFPVLERELCSDMVINGNNIPAGTQVIMMMDNFVHSTVFDPQTWLGEEKIPLRDSSLARANESV